MLAHENSYSSTVKQNEGAPVWNEHWRVKNVPATANLVITVMDKDERSYTDDFIGSITTTVAAGAKELEIEGPFHKRNNRGRLWLNVSLFISLLWTMINIPLLDRKYTGNR
jgi:Ca2+-dependent lipid-binding protein